MKQLPITLAVLILAGVVVQRWGGQDSHANSVKPAATVSATTADATGANAPALPPSEPSAGNPIEPPRPGARTRDQLLEAYPEVPRDEMVGNTPLQKELIAELKARYAAQLDKLRKHVNASGGRMVVAFLTPEFESDAQKALEPFIHAICDEMGIEYVNLTPRLRGLDPLTYTQMPRDGHWSARGAGIVAASLGDVLMAHSSERSTVSPGRAARPRLLGDLEPKQDVILDGGKDLPYRLQTNGQGLRLDHDLNFPKERQRILLLGDSQIYCPFLDNPDTIPAQLQRMHPEVEVVSAANLGYAIDDLDSLYRERARFIEPDLVIVQTGGGDILDQYFSHRNLFNRTKAVFEPSPLEERYHRTIARPAGRP